MIPRGSSPSPRRIAVSVAAELLLDRLEPQDVEPDRPWCRLSEAEAVMRLLHPDLRFRGVVGRMWPLLDGRVLTEAVELPGLGRGWIGEGWWLWEP